jgi:orotidine-5'-phosphate decarboxylase
MAVSRRATPIVALDVRDAGEALKLVDQLGELCGFYKIGSELYTAEGPMVVRRVQERGAAIFLDLKFHDIPNTVRGAVRSAGALGVRLLTVHASGGAAMLAAAAAEARESSPECRILAVTLLTSMDANGLRDVWGRGVDSMPSEVLRLAQLAADAGVHGIVCSGLEAAAVRDRFADSLDTLVPGVRLRGGDRQDQSRVVTPREAAEAGARYIVLGRAVTAAKSPPDAMREVLADLS